MKMPIAEYKYNLGTVEKGYNNRTLYINLTDNRITSKPVTKKMKETFIGGRGFNLWLLWNALPKNQLVKWNDPENEVCIACGPLVGTTQFPGSGKSIAVSISPLTDSRWNPFPDSYKPSFITVVPRSARWKYAVLVPPDLPVFF